MKRPRRSGRDYIASGAAQRADKSVGIAALAVADHQLPIPKQATPISSDLRDNNAWHRLFLRDSDGGSALKPAPPGLTPTEQFGSCLAQLGVQPTLVNRRRWQVREMSIQLGPPPPGFVADLPCAGNEARRGRSFGFAPAFPSAGLSYQALTFYPALTYGVYADRIHRAILGLLDFGNGGLSSIIYRIKVASVLSKQGRHNARGVRFGKIADTEFHARKIKRQPLIGNSRLKA